MLGMKVKGVVMLLGLGRRFNATTAKNMGMLLGNVRSRKGQKMQLITGKRCYCVSPDAVDSGPIFDTESEQKVQNDDHYDVFFIECQHPEQSRSVYKTYLIEQDAHNVLIESEDMNYDSEQID
uniref:Uncharacterized protein n=1 Tax=Tanacetum cinerariifolium TaxID=118510 RepID=A0A699SGX8_TANCI|nr:hypothetical protein [Tanacetum cinerariifolium]